MKLPNGAQADLGTKLEDYTLNEVDPHACSRFIISVQGLDMRGIGTQSVFGNDELEMRVVLAQLDNEAFGCVALTIVFVGALKGQ